MFKEDSSKVAEAFGFQFDDVSTWNAYIQNFDENHFRFEKDGITFSFTQWINDDDTGRKIFTIYRTDKISKSFFEVSFDTRNTDSKWDAVGKDVELAEILYKVLLKLGHFDQLDGYVERFGIMAP